MKSVFLANEQRSSEAAIPDPLLYFFSRSSLVTEHSILLVIDWHCARPSCSPPGSPHWSSSQKPKISSAAFSYWMTH